MGKFGQRGGDKKGVEISKKKNKTKIPIVKKNILAWSQFKAPFKYCKFCSKHFSIGPSLGGENGVEGKNIKIC